MFLINKLKNLVRKSRYNKRLSTFSKPEYTKDENYETVKQLREDGIFKKENFYESSNEAKELLNHYEKNISDEKVKEFINKHSNGNIYLEDGKTKSKRSYKLKITELFKENQLIDFANQKYLLDNIEQYFGLKPQIREINVQVDFKNKFFNNPLESQVFHRDYDDIKLIKLFYYLTDVSENNGPFQFIKKSHQHPWHIPYENQEKTNNYLSNSKQIYSCTGKKGAIILADTNGFHRGLELKDGYRVLMYATYMSKKPFKGSLKSIITYHNR
tara:strand:+ start:1651 stop:2463 length:813 start_codon:yes stop_codon:yes gene_type:complete